MTENMQDDILRVLISKEEVQKTVSRLGEEISRDYQGRQPVLVTVLKGAFIFMADLSRAITVPCTMDFMSLSSYGGGTSTTGQVKIRKDLDADIEGKDVLIVEDILDSGVTLSHLIELLKTRNPASLRLCTLFDKPQRRKCKVDVHYRGLEVPDEFIVGYGLDYDEKYRNLPDICILKPEIYTK